MPLWHCPHCGTPQPEAARCWVCRKSSTSCVTCRHFRRGVAVSLGYCGLDRRHAPLHGDEIRSCWEGAPEPSSGPAYNGTRSVDGAAAPAGIVAPGVIATQAGAMTTGARSLPAGRPTTTPRGPLVWREIEDPRAARAGLDDATGAAGEVDVAESGGIRGRAWVQGFWPDPDA